MKLTIGGKIFEVSKNEEGGYPEEATIEFDGILRTSEEEGSFIENHKKDARKEGLEIAVKQYRDEFGFEGRTIDKLIEGVKSKTLADAKIEPTEKLKLIQDTLAEKETALQNALTAKTEGETMFSNYKNAAKIDSTLDSLIPEKTILPREDMKMILKSRLNFNTDENGNITVLDTSGNVMKDAITANPKTAKEVVEGFFKDNQTYLKPNEGGAGGGDSGTPGTKTSMDDFIETQRAAGNAPNSLAFNEALQPLVKAGSIDMS